MNEKGEMGPEKNSGKVESRLLGKSSGVIHDLKREW